MGKIMMIMMITTVIYEMPPIYTCTSCSTTFILILTLIQKGNYYYLPSYPFTEEKLRIRKAQAQWFTQDCATVPTLLWWSITHSSTLAWKIPWTEEPGGLQSMGLLGVGHDWEIHFHFSLSCIGEGNGNPLLCSCLENPWNGGAWWAALYGVAQSQTRLKRLSSIEIGFQPTADLNWDLCF